MPVASTRTTTSPARTFGSGASSNNNCSGPPRAWSLIAFTESAGAPSRESALEDGIRLSVDLALVGLREVALLRLLRRPRLGVPRVRFIGHRVLALLGQPELRLLHRVALLLTELGHHGTSWSRPQSGS